MTIKEPKQTESAPDPFLCSTQRRSARLNSAGSEAKPVVKPAKISSEVEPYQDMSDQNGQVNTGEAYEVKKPKRKRKLFQGFVKKKKVPKKSKLDPGNGNHHEAVGDAAVMSRLLVDDQKASDHAGENDEIQEENRAHHHQGEIFTQSIQINESPRKTRINKAKLEVCSNGVSPKKASRQQYFNASDTGHIQAVKAALHLSTVPDTMMCRDAEQSKVFKFCKDHLLQQQPGSLYICGCPGTGKSLLMEKVKLLASKWTEEGDLQAPEIIGFNCTSLTNPNDIFDKILQHVSPQQRKKKVKSSNLPELKRVKYALRKPGNGSSGRMLMLIVDEMDYLLGKDQTILHELFELPAQTESRCILIGISNAIDLADRFLPNFSSLSCHPMVVSFSPYTKDQVIAVLNQRTKVLPFSVFQPAALELCARKVAAASGDMRKALHVCRIAVEQLELETHTGTNGKAEQNGMQSSRLELQSTPSKKIGSTAQDKQKQSLVQIHHMAQALARTFRSAIVDIVKALPKHQQMVLCAAVRLFRQKKKDATLGQLNVGYVEFCKSTGMSALSVPEFSSVCRVLADQGLLNLGSSREERLRRVTLQVDEDDIVFSLQAVRFFCNNLT